MSANSVQATDGDTPFGGTRTAEHVPFCPLDRQHAPLAAELHEVFGRLLHTSGFVLGEEVRRFETEFAEFCAVEHCVGVSSGTAALSLILRASEIGRGDEVIVPAHTFIATALAVVHAGARPVLCDVEPATGLIDPEAARALAGPRTAAVIGVHLYGQAFDVPAIEAFARPAGLLVIEDAAQAHGARHGDHPAGSLGAAAAFSFYPTKNLGALGDGGAVCTNDPEVAARVRRLRNLGQARKGEHVEAGWNERLDGLQAGLLRAKLPHVPRWNDARRRHAAAYREHLPGSVITLQEPADSHSVYHLFPVRVRDRDGLAARLQRRGVETGIHYSPAVYDHPVWSARKLDCGPVENAERWAAEELSLPMHPALLDSEIDRVADALSAEVTASL